MMNFASHHLGRIPKIWLISVLLIVFSALPVVGQSYSVTVLTPTADVDSRASSINANGSVVGSFQTLSGNWHAFLFNGTFSDLGTLGGPNSEAVSINATGDAVGSSDPASGKVRHAFLYHAGQMLDLNNPPAGETTLVLTSAVQITDGGQIIALAVQASSSAAFLLSPLPTASCSSSTASESSLSLQLWMSPAGCFALSSWTGNLPLVMSNSTSISNQATSGSSGAQLVAFNSRGDGVGYSSINASDRRAVLLTKDAGAAVDLNNLIRADSGWTLNEATGINDYGQITGTGVYQGHVQAFLLTPLQPQTASSVPTSTTQPVLNAAIASTSTPAPTAHNAQTSSATGLDVTGPTGAAGGVLAGQYPNPLFAGITAGPVVFGNGSGTVGQDSSFVFNSTTKQLSLTDATGVYNTATLNLSKGPGSSSSLDLLETDNSGKILRILQPGDQLKKTPTVYIDNGAGMYMRSWITVSGTTNGLTGDGYAIVPPSKDPLMIGIWADVGTGLQVRTGNITGAYNYSNLDRHGNYTMSIEEDGGLRWGTSTRAAMDTGLSRDSAGVLQVNTGVEGNFGDLKARNVIANGSVQFMTASTGTGSASLGSNSPAANPAQPATWINVVLPDGSTGYVPVWK